MYCLWLRLILLCSVLQQPMCGAPLWPGVQGLGEGAEPRGGRHWPGTDTEEIANFGVESGTKHDCWMYLENQIALLPRTRQKTGASQKWEFWNVKKSSSFPKWFLLFFQIFVSVVSIVILCILPSLSSGPQILQNKNTPGLFISMSNKLMQKSCTYFVETITSQSWVQKAMQRIPN